MEYSFWKSILFTALFGTVYMYAVQNFGQRFIEEEKVALAYLTEPIFATIAAVILIDEKLTLYSFIGGLLIFAAMLLSDVKTGRLRLLVLTIANKR